MPLSGIFKDTVNIFLFYFQKFAPDDRIKPSVRSFFYYVRNYIELFKELKLLLKKIAGTISMFGQKWGQFSGSLSPLFGQINFFKVAQA